MMLGKRKIISLGVAAVMMFTPITALAADQNAQSGEKKPVAIAEFSGAKAYAEAAAATVTGQYGVASLQYALMDQGEITLSGRAGTYSKTGNKALAAGDIYNIGSVSKVYCTAAILKLAEQGKLDIDQPVTKYLPEFKMKDSRYKEITVRMLINHSSGLNGSTFVDAFTIGDYNPDVQGELLDRLAEQNLKADPGAFSVYCNDGFVMAELVVEKVSGVTFSKFMEDNFFTPMDLKNTRTAATVAEEDSLPDTYVGALTQAIGRDSVNIIGTGGMYSSAEDMAAFGNVLIGNQPKIFTESSAKKMQNAEFKRGTWVPEGSKNTISFGLGWDTVELYPFTEYGITAVAKGGDSLASHASLVALPEYDMVASVVSSGGNSAFNQGIATNILLHTLKEKGIIEEIKPDKVITTSAAAAMPAEFEKYSGVYGVTGTTCDVAVKDQKAVISLDFMPGAGTQELFYIGNGKFQSSDGGVLCSFVETGGHTYLMVEAWSSIPMIGQSVSTYFDVQKLEKNAVDEKAKVAWEARNGKKYYYVSEGPESQTLITAPFAALMVDSTNGYVFGCKIIDENTANQVVQIPVAGGRDTYDIEVINENGMEVIKLGSYLMISQDSIKPLWSGGKAISTVMDDGYARWYNVPAGMTGKIAAVAVPEGGAFAVYDAAGTCTHHSIVSGTNSATLPEGGSLVFLGEPGMRFEITVK